MPYLNDLIVRVDGKRYFLVEDFAYMAEHHGIHYSVTVPKGFKTDFASIPRAFRSVFTGHDRTRKAAVIHDYAYAKKLHSRSRCDWLFLNAMKESNVPRWKRYAMYMAVRAGGWAAW